MSAQRGLEYNTNGYQVPVNESILLQVLHPFADILRDAQQGLCVEAAPPLSDVVE